MEASQQLTGQATVEQLRRRSALVFILLALLAVFAYFFLSGQTADERASAAEINLAGKRRMLSQRIGLLGSELLHEQRAQDLVELSKALERMRSIHNALMRGALEQGIRAPRTEKLRASYAGPEGVDASMQRFLAQGQALLQIASEGGDYRASARQLVAMSQGEFLEALDQLVDQYQAESETSTDTLRLLQWCALLAALGLLAFSAVGVLRPLIAQVRSSLDEQAASEMALREADLRLHHFQRRLVDAIEALDDAFALFDVDDRLILYNQRFIETFPLCGEIIAVGMPFSVFVRNIAEQRLYAIPSDKTEAWIAERMEIHHKAKGSREIPLAEGRWLRATERRTREGGTVVIWSDISHLKQTLIAADQASDAKSEFMARMSHELRTPLNAILGFAQVLAQGLGAPLTPQQNECVAHIRQGGEHLLALINEVLDLSAIEAGHLSIEMEALPLAPLIKECQVLISPQALGRQVVLNTSYSGHCAVRGDRKRLKQVLLNLLSNGIKYNCEGGQLTLSVIEHEATIRLTVTDTGQGIPPDLTNRVFQPFDRLGASNVEGTGIGLSITRRLVELMGGHIGFDSTLGVGTTFWVELDKAPSESCAPASLLSAASNASPTDSEAIPNTTMRDTVTYHILAIALSPAENELLRLIVSTLRGACLTLLTSLEEASEVISRQPCLAIIADAVLINTFLATMPQQGQDTPVLIALNDQDGAPPGVDPRIHHEQVKPLKTREIARILREAMP
ncbi:MAG: ATP-binding protein [Azonexus sp.]|nr:ATP-binding protein [Azonexus sp.]MDZ4314498.1 ATP-binding protein [Azonexus sp.]